MNASTAISIQVKVGFETDLNLFFTEHPTPTVNDIKIVNVTDSQIDLIYDSSK